MTFIKSEENLYSSDPEGEISFIEYLTKIE